MSLVDARTLLATISNGRLADTIAHSASTCKEDKDIYVDMRKSFDTPCYHDKPIETLSEDESSDDDVDMDALRRRHKNASETVFVSRSRPASAAQSRRTNFQSMHLLADAALMVQKILSEPPKPMSAWLSKDEEKEEKANESPKAPGYSCDDEKSTPASVASTPTPTRPSSARSTTARPSLRPSRANKRSPTNGAASKPDVNERPLVPTLARPEIRRSSKSRSSTTLQMSPKAEAFRLEDDEEPSKRTPSSSRPVRDSSLARNYDALGTMHCSLDDGSDAEFADAPDRESSIVRTYEAMGVGRVRPSRSSRSASPAMLPPVAPPRKDKPPTPPSQPVREKKLAPQQLSAMEMDLDLRGSASGHLRPTSKSGRTPEQRPQSSSLGSLRLASPQLKQSPSFLPKLPAKSRAGSSSASIWGVPPVSPAMEWDGQRCIF